MKPASVRDIIKIISHSLSEVYGDPAEGKSVAELLLMNLMNSSRAGLYGIGGRIDDPEMLKRIQDGFLRLHQNEPIQYVLGKVLFCGLDLKIHKGILIPRIETEELVEWVVEVCQVEPRDFHILDIGTGSGCIALALKSKMPFAEVTGIDISEEAIRLAEENSKRLNLDVNWSIQDLFAPDFKFDTDRKLIVVSNPPYVLDSEKIAMAARVTGFEPAAALFVSEKDPLLYYRRMTELFHGKASALFFEINPLTSALFEILAIENDFSCQIRKDFCERDRMVFFKRLNVR